MRAQVAGKSTIKVSRNVCGLPDTSDYLYVLAVAGLLLLPDVQSLKIGGFEFKQLSNEVANQAVQVKEQTEEVAKQTKQIQELKNDISQVVHTSQNINLALGYPPEASATQGDAVGSPKAEGQPLGGPVLVPQRVIGPRRRETLAVRANLAQRIGEFGDAAKALEQYTALLPVMQKELGPNDRETLMARAKLADWTGEAGDAAKALEQYTALVPILERILGA